MTSTKRRAAKALAKKIGTSYAGAINQMRKGSKRAIGPFPVDHVLTPKDLTVRLIRPDKSPCDPYSIKFYFEAPGTSGQPWDTKGWHGIFGGHETMWPGTPVRVGPGQYCALGTLQEGYVSPGKHRIKWVIRETADSPESHIYEEFNIVPYATPSPVPPVTLALIELALSQETEEGVLEDLTEILRATVGNVEGLLLQRAVRKGFHEEVSRFKDAPPLRDPEELPYLYAILGESKRRRSHDEWKIQRIQAPLGIAASNGDLQSIELLLSRPDCNLNQAALEASSHFHPEALEFFLDLGVDVNWASGSFLRNTSWHPNFTTDEVLERFKRDSLRCVKLLLSRGANPDLPNPDSDKPWHALVAASHWGCHANVKALLDGGADPNIGEGAALMEALKMDRTSTIRVLFEGGADRLPWGHVVGLLKRGRGLKEALDFCKFSAEDLTALAVIAMSQAELGSSMVKNESFKVLNILLEYVDFDISPLIEKCRAFYGAVDSGLFTGPEGHGMGFLLMQVRGFDRLAQKIRDLGVVTKEDLQETARLMDLYRPKSAKR